MPSNDESVGPARLLEHTADIVGAYVSRNAISAADLPKAIQRVHDQLALLDRPTPVEAPLVPAVPIDASVRDEHIVCLDCGRTFKTLKRHLRTDHGLTPEAYRAKWGLRRDYPVVAAAYSRMRKGIAHDLGLGRGVRRKTPS